MRNEGAVMHLMIARDDCLVESYEEFIQLPEGNAIESLGTDACRLCYSGETHDPRVGFQEAYMFAVAYTRHRRSVLSDRMMAAVKRAARVYNLDLFSSYKSILREIDGDFDLQSYFNVLSAVFNAGLLFTGMACTKRDVSYFYHSFPYSFSGYRRVHDYWSVIVEYSSNYALSKIMLVCKMLYQLVRVLVVPRQVRYVMELGNPDKGVIVDVWECYNWYDSDINCSIMDSSRRCIIHSSYVCECVLVDGAYIDMDGYFPVGLRLAYREMHFISPYLRAGDQRFYYNVTKYLPHLEFPFLACLVYYRHVMFPQSISDQDLRVLIYYWERFDIAFLNIFDIVAMIMPRRPSFKMMYDYGLENSGDMECLEFMDDEVVGELK
jgi:hypothetical protein